MVTWNKLNDRGWYEISASVETPEVVEKVVKVQKAYQPVVNSRKVQETRGPWRWSGVAGHWVRKSLPSIVQ